MYYRNSLHLLGVFLLVGCSALSPYSTQTRLQLKLTGNELLNPDINGRPSPVVVRLLELRNPVAFETRDFFTLYGRSAETLAQDLVASEELELRPGQSVDLKLRVEPGSRYVGVMAAYRNLPDSQWRYVLELTPEGLTQADLTLSDDGIHRVGATPGVPRS
ncbi:type VI secretion system lipoprotein TssJ [Pseudomonas sp. v388]|uniref:type VI secretion system lipoprotein TssJ n=1 Tax=Pseudomonas sp. v388 TaxID=2479849 RepID=UPI000F76DC90|nr:type VI secretion system lipoprotein TssJ [Pseudomonas sp. v388]RRV05327.1 type VI secretion system lipoprotein TssJ [Pseudomonas sp. v388]